MLRLVYEHWRLAETSGQDILMVSSLGRVKINKKLVEPLVGKNTGYFYIVFKGKKKAVHRLVARAFIKKDLSSEDTVDHRDSNRRDNRVKNLEVVSGMENQERARVKLTDDVLKDFANASITVVSGSETFRTLRSAAMFVASERERKNEGLVWVVASHIAYAAIFNIQYRGRYWSLDLKE